MSEGPQYDEQQEQDKALKKAKHLLKTLHSDEINVEFDPRSNSITIVLRGVYYITLTIDPFYGKNVCMLGFEGGHKGVPLTVFTKYLSQRWVDDYWSSGNKPNGILTEVYALAKVEVDNMRINDIVDFNVGLHDAFRNHFTNPNEGDDYPLENS